ncbi:MAG: chemotaxis protein CheW [Gemmatimonadaceae bacterium]
MSNRTRGSGPRNVEWGAFDWSELRRRVEEAGEAVREAGQLSPEQATKVLEERARDLAVPVTVERTEEIVELITFSLAGQAYAVESRYVVEVFPLTDLAYLPGAESPVLGLTGWRGRLLVIVDLRQMLGQPSKSLDDQKFVLVLGKEQPVFGILADLVADMLTLSTSQISQLPYTEAANGRFMRGVTREAQLVLDAAVLLEEERQRE